MRCMPGGGVVGGGDDGGGVLTSGQCDDVGVLTWSC